jgi:hypothetical protein
VPAHFENKRKKVLKLAASLVLSELHPKTELQKLETWRKQLPGSEVWDTLESGN